MYGVADHIRHGTVLFCSGGLNQALVRVPFRKTQFHSGDDHRVNLKHKERIMQSWFWSSLYKDFFVKLTN